MENSDRKLLITGGTGYIGSHTLVEILEADGMCGFSKIVVIDNLSNSSKVCLDKVDIITGDKCKKNVIFEDCDIRHEEHLDDVFTRHGPIHAVIHFAGLKAVGESCSKPLLYYENNVGGTVALLKVMEKHNCKDIVFSSSATVYGDNPVAKEGDSIFPTNPYG